MSNNIKYLRNGCGLIAEERDRQIQKLGYDTAHDDAHSTGELTFAARCFAGHAAGMMRGCDVNTNTPQQWPWEPEHWKPSADPARDLVKAGALIAAELDRLHRQFKDACNAFAEKELGFTVFDEMDAYDLEGLDWIGVDPESFIREHFAEDLEMREYDDDLQRQGEESEADISEEEMAEICGELDEELGQEAEEDEEAEDGR